jgi:hypothetical protein
VSCSAFGITSNLFSGLRAALYMSLAYTHTNLCDTKNYVRQGGLRNQRAQRPTPKYHLKLHAPCSGGGAIFACAHFIYVACSFLYSFVAIADL